MPPPLVSVLMPAYNHGPFIAEAIASVLSQDFGNIELVVADDGSSDNTADVVRSFDDPRLSFVAHPVNRGAAVVHNELLTAARGEYVALINSDDIWLPGKLEAQVEFLRLNPEFGACFTTAEFIDRGGNTIPKDTLPFGNVFDVANRSRAMWLRHLFFFGNCLCHPSVLMRRALYDSVGPYDGRLRQLPDYEMWIRVAKVAEIHVIERPFVGFRILPGENVSGTNRANAVRTMNEHALIASDYFSGVSANLLIEGFSEFLSGHLISSKQECDIEGALLLFAPAPWLQDTYRLVGLQKLHALLGSQEHRSVLKSKYGIDERTLHERSVEVDVLRPDLRPEVVELRSKVQLLTEEVSIATTEARLAERAADIAQREIGAAFRNLGRAVSRRISLG